MVLEIKRTRPEAIIPVYKTNGAAGFDLHAAHDCAWVNNCIVDTGLAFSIPEGYELQIRGRSGLAFNENVFCHVGTIDADYLGVVKVKLYDPTGSGKVHMIKQGDRIAQAILAPVRIATFVVVDEFEKTSERGVNGFGSTGK